MLGTKWTIKIETTEAVGDGFLRRIIVDGIGLNINDEEITSNVEIYCDKELPEGEQERIRALNTIE